MMTPVGTLFVILLVTGTSFSIGSAGSHAWPVLLWVSTSALYLAAGMVAWRRRPLNRIGLACGDGSRVFSSWPAI
ncbi:MAG: hypothetical protein M3Y49_00960 [Actinomycetota bacterium]|nr:hypothetical protein [Actinomycetota bacterium]